MIIKQRENEAISSFEDRFQTEFNLIPGADQKIVVIAFIEGLRMRKFKESLLKKKPSSLEEVNERAYKYIRIEEAEKRAEKGREKRPVEESRQRSPDPKRRSAFNKIKVPDRGYSRADLPRSSAFSHLQDEQKKEAKWGKIEYVLNPLRASVGHIFMEIEVKRILPRPPNQKTSQYKKNMSKGAVKGVHSQGYAEYVDILYLDAYLKMGMSRPHIRPVATPLVGFTGDAVNPLGVANLMVTMEKRPQQAKKMVEFTIVDMSEGAYNGIIRRLSLSQFEAVVSLIHLKM
ncbi:hypothetical protein LIER_28215 [Lithospermum erythrorhizon]|uniref:Retrotransposon gag domain-containing protein n=1 Tax=Lithospermum erythrorhizon TaxID=34254 RepID=A0AAV3RIN4_LITER